MSLYISNGVSPDRAKPSLVLLHAFPLSSEMWRAELNAAREKSIAAVAINAPGFGGRKREPGWRLKTFAGDVKKIIEELDLHNVILGGLSMGGYAVLAFNKAYPGVARGILLADTQAPADTAEAKAGRSEFARAVMEHGSGEAARRMFPKLTSETTKKNFPELVAQIERWIRQADPAAIADALEALGEREDSTPSLGSITVPTLILCGERDELTPLTQSKLMQEKISSSTLVTLKASGHLSNLEAPKEFWNAVEKFLYSGFGVRGSGLGVRK